MNQRCAGQLHVKREVLVMALAMALLHAVPAQAEVSALVAVTPAQTREMAQVIGAYGTVEFAPEGGRTLSLEAEALVSQVLVAAGQRVKKGEALLRVEPSVNDRMQLEQARIAVRFAAADLKRIEGLRSRQLATNADVQAAAQTLARARATLSDITARLRPLTGGVLRTPMDGVVEGVQARQGDLVAAGQPLLRLAKGDRLRVLLGVEPEDLPQVQVNDAVRVRPVFGAPAAYAGKVSQIYWQVDPKTRLAQVVVPLPATPAMLPGSMVRGEIETARATVLAVPESAILTQGSQAYCYVVVGGRAELRHVQTGWRQDGWVAIQGPVRAGDPVVRLGNYELRPGMAVRPEAGR